MDPDSALYQPILGAGSGKQIGYAAEHHQHTLHSVGYHAVAAPGSGWLFLHQISSQQRFEVMIGLAGGAKPAVFYQLRHRAAALQHGCQHG